MSVFISLGIIVLSILIMTFLTLTSGVFALFNHYAYGKYSRKKAETLTFYFILGYETMSSCVFLSVYLLVAIAVADLSHLGTNIMTWILLGIIIALAFISLFFYYRRGPGTRLFIPRTIATSLLHHAKTAKTRSDAFTLGALSSTPELIFTLPLYIITSAEILQLSTTHPGSSLLTVFYIVVPTIPLFIERWRFHLGHNLADAARSRVHNKNFTRFFLCLNYFLIAFLIISFRF